MTRPSGHSRCLCTSVDVTEDADRLLASTLPDGAICTYTDRLGVNPYFAHFAAMGLTRAGQVTGNSAYYDAVWKWLDWYASHMDATGFVTDYNVGAAPTYTLTSTGDYDSTDSYAGMFLVAIRRIWRVTRDFQRLRSLGPAMTKAVKAIKATQQADGQTWAKPTYHIKYLMDQGEAYAGLRAAVELGGLIGEPALQWDANASATAMYASVNTKWNFTLTAYDWVLFEDGAFANCNWATMYPDVSSQAWAVSFGLTSGQRAIDIVAKLAIQQPLWDSPATAGYWPQFGFAFARTGDMSRALKAAANIRQYAKSVNWAWPFHSGALGDLIRLESLDTDYLAPP